MPAGCEILALPANGAAKAVLDVTWWRARRISAFTAMLAIVPAMACSAPPLTLQPPAEPHHVACIPADGRQGQPGCWELASIPISASAGTPLYWHVYEFPSVAEAKQAKDNQSQIIEAYGRVWLEAVTVQSWTPRGDRRSDANTFIATPDGFFYGGHVHAGNEEQGPYASGSRGLGGFGR